MFKYCATVVLFNPEISVLNSIHAYAGIFDKIIVINNSINMNNDLVSKLRLIENVEYISQDGNKGISNALNIAFRKAIKGDYDFILTMDQDSIYSSKDIKQMLDYIESNYSEDVGIYASNYCRFFYDHKKNSKVVSKPRYPTDKVNQVLCAITSGSFVSAKALHKIIPLDENYFIANVDIDLAAQMQIKGYKTVLVGNSIFYQQVGGDVSRSLLSEKLRFTNYSSTRYYYQVRNTFYLLNKYKNNSNFRWFAYLQLVKYIFKISTSERNKIQKIKQGYLGYKDFKKGIFGKKPEID